MNNITYENVSKGYHDKGEPITDRVTVADYVPSVKANLMETLVSTVLEGAYLKKPI